MVQQLLLTQLGSIWVDSRRHVKTWQQSCEGYGKNPIRSALDYRGITLKIKMCSLDLKCVFFDTCPGAFRAHLVFKCEMIDTWCPWRHTWLYANSIDHTVWYPYLNTLETVMVCTRVKILWCGGGDSGRGGGSSFGLFLRWTGPSYPAAVCTKQANMTVSFHIPHL